MPSSQGNGEASEANDNRLLSRPPPQYSITRGEDDALQWEPPIGSRELANALSYHYPMENGLREKMQRAILDFLDSEIADGELTSKEIKADLMFHSGSEATGLIPVEDEAIGKLRKTSGKAAPLPPQKIQVPDMCGIWDIRTGEPVKGKGRKRALSPTRRKEVAENRGNTCEYHQKAKTRCDPTQCQQNKLYPGTSIKSRPAKASGEKQDGKDGPPRTGPQTPPETPATTGYRDDHFRRKVNGSSSISPSVSKSTTQSEDEQTPPDQSTYDEPCLILEEGSPLTSLIPYPDADGSIKKRKLIYGFENSTQDVIFGPQPASESEMLFPWTINRDSGGEINMTTGDQAFLENVAPKEWHPVQETLGENGIDWIEALMASDMPPLDFDWHLESVAMSTDRYPGSGSEQLRGDLIGSGLDSGSEYLFEDLVGNGLDSVGYSRDPAADWNLSETKQFSQKSYYGSSEGTAFVTKAGIDAKEELRVSGAGFRDIYKPGSFLSPVSPASLPKLAVLPPATTLQPPPCPSPAASLSPPTPPMPSVSSSKRRARVISKEFISAAERVPVQCSLSEIRAQAASEAPQDADKTGASIECHQRDERARFSFMDKASPRSSLNQSDLLRPADDITDVVEIDPFKEYSNAKLPIKFKPSTLGPSVPMSASESPLVPPTYVNPSPTLKHRKSHYEPQKESSSNPAKLSMAVSEASTRSSRLGSISRVPMNTMNYFKTKKASGAVPLASPLQSKSKRSTQSFQASESPEVSGPRADSHPVPLGHPSRPILSVQDLASLLQDSSLNPSNFLEIVYCPEGEQSSTDIILLGESDSDLQGITQPNSLRTLLRASHSKVRLICSTYRAGVGSSSKGTTSDQPSSKILQLASETSNPAKEELGSVRRTRDLLMAYIGSIESHTKLNTDKERLTVLIFISSSGIVVKRAIVTSAENSKHDDPSEPTRQALYKLKWPDLEWRKLEEMVEVSQVNEATLSYKFAAEPKPINLNEEEVVEPDNDDDERDDWRGENEEDDKQEDREDEEEAEIAHPHRISSARPSIESKPVESINALNPIRPLHSMASLLKKIAGIKL